MAESSDKRQNDSTCGDADGKAVQARSPGCDGTWRADTEELRRFEHRAWGDSEIRICWV